MLPLNPRPVQSALFAAFSPLGTAQARKENAHTHYWETTHVSALRDHDSATRIPALVASPLGVHSRRHAHNHDSRDRCLRLLPRREYNKVLQASPRISPGAKALHAHTAPFFALPWILGHQLPRRAGRFFPRQNRRRNKTPRARAQISDIPTKSWKNCFRGQPQKKSAAQIYQGEILLTIFSFQGLLVELDKL